MLVEGTVFEPPWDSMLTNYNNDIYYVTNNVFWEIYI